MDPFVTSLCQHNVDCSNPPRLLKDAVTMCEISKKASRCDVFAKENPELARLVKKCDAKSYCTQNIAALQGLEAACWRGYKSAAIDLGIAVKDIAVGLAEYVDRSWEKLKSSSANKTPVKIEASRAKVSAASATELNSTQKSRLREMGEAAMGAFEKAKVKYNCITPLAQAEMRCYAIGTVFDPTLLAGYALKMVRTVRVVSELSEAAHVNSEVRIGVQGVKTLGQISRAQLVEKYLYFSPTTASQNKKWMDLASTVKASDKVHFVNFENAEMQSLNTTLMDKNLVTSLTNYHKDLVFRRIEDLKKEFPGLEVEAYSDYKSARFAFKGQAPPDLQQRLAQIFKDTNQEYRDYLIQNKVIRATEAPQNWIRAGAGDTADQANFATRYSRKVETNQLQNFADPEVSSLLKASFQQAEKLRTQISDAVSPQSSLMKGKTLDADAFNIVRKNSGNPEVIQSALIQRYGLKDISLKTVKDIESYAAKVDEFSPDLYIVKREVATLHEAPKGGISADMVGMGAQNLRSTADALVQAKNADEAIVQARAMERKVTEGFNEQKDGFQKVVADAVGADRMKTICSGDDCVSIANSALNSEDKSKILQGLADQGYSSKFRLSFIPEGIPEASARTSLATHGETIEKMIQKNLSQEMEPGRMKGLIFGVDMQTTKLNEGPVKLLIGTSKDVNLTAAERVKIQESFQKSIEQMNQELQSQGVKAQYLSVH